MTYADVSCLFLCCWVAVIYMFPTSLYWKKSMLYTWNFTRYEHVMWSMENKKSEKVIDQYIFMPLYFLTTNWSNLYKMLTKRNTENAICLLSLIINCTHEVIISLHRPFIWFHNFDWPSYSKIIHDNVKIMNRKTKEGLM